MHFGVLQTGKVHSRFNGKFGEYSNMFEHMFQQVDPTVRVTSFAALDGILPKSPQECDAWLITGSPHGVYDKLPWMEPLKEFIRAVRAQRIPLIGVCFGHQIMAEAFGGQVEKSASGWGCGVHRYTTQKRPQWMADAPAELTLHAMHQDQVTKLPKDATVLASSTFCPNAMLSYGDPEAPDAISIQPHPEFSPDFTRALVDWLGGERIPQERADAAMASIGQAVNTRDFAQWCLRFCRQAQKARSLA